MSRSDCVHGPRSESMKLATHEDICFHNAYARLEGDIVVCAAYCAGLLLTRRVLQKFHLDSVYEGEQDSDRKSIP